MQTSAWRIVAVLMLAASVVDAAPVEDLRGLKAVLPGRFLVKPTDRSVWEHPQRRARLAADLGGRFGVSFTVQRQVALGWLELDVADLKSEAATIALAKRLASDPALKAADVNGVRRTQRLPSDPLLDTAWHIANMRLPDAWDITVGVGTTRLGVVDTGILPHEDLNPDQVGFDFISIKAIANDGDDRDDDPRDECLDTGFHGTHVAGLMAAQGDNAVGTVGGTWRGRLAVARSLGCGGFGSAADVAEGALWLAGVDVPDVVALPKEDQVRIINLSLSAQGSTDCGPFEADLYAALDDAGIIVVAAAGNEGRGVASPANCPNVIAVAASSRADELAPYSNFGPEIDIVAPGGDFTLGLEGGVLSTSSSEVSSLADGSPYDFKEGTSMATPNVAGVISLLLEGQASLDRFAVVDALQRTGRPCATCRGVPLIDAAAAVGFIHTGGGSRPRCSSVNNGCATAGDTVCDEVGVAATCAAGTDALDCGLCVDVPAGGGGNNNVGEPPPVNEPRPRFPPCDLEGNNSCASANDDVCDESDGTNRCDDGTDARDCGRCGFGIRGTGEASVCGSAGLGSVMALGFLLRRRRRRAPER